MVKGRVSTVKFPHKKVTLFNIDTLFVYRHEKATAKWPTILTRQPVGANRCRHSSPVAGGILRVPVSRADVVTMVREGSARLAGSPCKDWIVGH